MSEKKVKEIVEKALDAEEFDVLDYLEGQPIATDEVVIYTDVVRARRYHELMSKREDVLAERELNKEHGKEASLSLVEGDEDTEFDEELEELREGLKKTALTFVLQTVSPNKVKKITEKAMKKFDEDWEAAKVAEFNAKLGNEVLALGINHVVRGDGSKDMAKWDGPRLRKLEDALYTEQMQILTNALNDMVFSGAVFDEALTSDF